MTRISSLPGLGQCPAFTVLRASGADSGSAAADNGSAAGRMVELWHRGGEGPTALEEAIRIATSEAAERFPRADLDQARTWAVAYAADSRNRGVVLPDSCEMEVRIKLDPSPEDPTGHPIELVGHLDQLRRDAGGQLRVWDLKTGKGSGLELLYTHAWQIAAYALATSEVLGEPVLPGGVIRLRGYERSRNPVPPSEAAVHFEAPWSIEQCKTMLATAVQHIAWLRAGLVHMHPGIHCQWCPAGSPALCGDRIDRLAALPKNLVGLPENAA